MTILALIRHAENDFITNDRLAGRLADVHLNAKGLEQAQALAEKLAGSKIQAIYSSPLERALETAEPIARIFELPVLQRPALLEVDFGDWQNQTLEILRQDQLWKYVSYAPSLVTFPNGESYAQAQYRIQQELSQLAGNYAEKDWVACISHGDMIKLAVAYFIGLPLDMFQRLKISPASITLLSINETGARLLALNVDSSFTLALE